MLLTFKQLPLSFKPQIGTRFVELDLSFRMVEGRALYLIRIKIYDQNEIGVKS